MIGDGDNSWLKEVTTEAGNAHLAPHWPRQAELLRWLRRAPP